MRWGLMLLTMASLAAAAAGTAQAMSAQAQQQEWTIPDARLTPLAWGELEGWGEDDHGTAFDAFLASCRAIAARRRPPRAARPIDAPLAAICAEALILGPATAEEARDFLETRFQPVLIARHGQPEGFLTGYYEPIVEGSRVPTGEFKVPVYRRPKDLVSAARRHGPGFPNAGGALRRVSNQGAGKQAYVPYHDRGEIEDGALAGKGLEICWLRDPVDLFFIQIQGSARVRLEDGAVIRLNYAAHNGHPYTAVGGHLVDRGIMERDEVSMQRIRAWMQENPEEGREVRRLNRSFVFFRIADLTDGEEAVGGQGVPLTPERSIAIDSRLHAYGTPFWIDAELPLTGNRTRDRFRRLMIGQDTGSAIVGPARGDLYFGGGDEAGRIAGRIRHPGRFVMLVPRSLVPVTGPQVVPVPRSRPPA